MNTIVFYAVSAACSGGSCPPTVQAITVTPPAPVVIYQTVPRPLRPLFAVRPQVIVIQPR